MVAETGKAASQRSAWSVAWARAWAQAAALHLVYSDYLDNVHKGAPDERYRGGTLDDSRHCGMADRHWPIKRRSRKLQSRGGGRQTARAVWWDG